MLEFQQLFAKERPKQRFTSKIFEKFLIFTFFKQNSPDFLPKSAGFRGDKKKIWKIPGFWQKIHVQNCCKTLFCWKNSGGGEKKVKFKQLFAKERPKPRFTRRIFEKFATSSKTKVRFWKFLKKTVNFGRFWSISGGNQLISVSCRPI